MTRLTRREILAAAAAYAVAAPALRRGARRRSTRSPGQRACASAPASHGARRAPTRHRSPTRTMRRCSSATAGIARARKRVQMAALAAERQAHSWTSRASRPCSMYAEAKGMAMRGHTLLWHKAECFPNWLNEHDFGAQPANRGGAADHRPCHHCLHALCGQDPHCLLGRGQRSGRSGQWRTPAEDDFLAEDGLASRRCSIWSSPPRAMGSCHRPARL